MFRGTQCHNWISEHQGGLVQDKWGTVWPSRWRTSRSNTLVFGGSHPQNEENCLWCLHFPSLACLFSGNQRLQWAIPPISLCVDGVPVRMRPEFPSLAPTGWRSSIASGLLLCQPFDRARLWSWDTSRGVITWLGHLKRGTSRRCSEI